ncbi:hypothetical protein BWI96_05155 [Siphonobacter sp. SORGH_AS_0500]|uniref:hypothetical protein n=1 Tax=Siphonobacter sp. SORGH_AS_0500 TaxID=1864824 RepID=UPI000CB3DACE|nr:hypothetical protein [Siphonobacter sp. SORGH_AS_0500]PKK37849.1 hypothetical protein BWI96_05155 [Siphonobacter sp. SORGH_AS_0500]
MMRVEKLFEKYENYILTNHISDDCGIALEKIGLKLYSKKIKTDLSDIENLRNSLSNCFMFITNKVIIKKPIWFKINVIDQAVNEYAGIGLLNLESDWFKFIINYFEYDKASQSGDTIIVIFDHDFKWIICFTYSQDETSLTTEIYSSNSC